MTGGAIGLAMGVMGVATSLFFVGQKLIETSTVVDGLEFLGGYGSAVLAFAAVAIYVPLNTLIALKLGGMLERLTIGIQQAEGSYRGELTTFLRRSFHVAASRGETVQKEMHARLYVDIDRTWARLNWVHSGYMSFELIYNFVGGAHRRLWPGPDSLHPRQDQSQGLYNRRRTGQFADQPMLVVHPCHAGDRHAEGQCPARDRSRRGDRERAAAAGILPPDRPLRFPLRQPARGVRPDRSRISN